jgi:deoxyribonuclease-4
VHAPYFLNAAAKEKATWRAAVEIISQELQRAATLQAAYLVIHCGHNEDAEQGLVRTQTAVMEAFTVADVSGVALLLENAAGMGNEIGFRFRELGALCHSLRKESLPVGLCLDSCHAFVADYDFTVPEGWQNMLNEVEEYCGWETVKLIHVNDAVGKAGSRFDRHAALGKGEIGGKGFKNLFSHPVLGQLPAVLETPRKSEQDDQENLEFLRRLRQEIRKGRHH